NNAGNNKEILLSVKETGTNILTLRRYGKKRYDGVPSEAQSVQLQVGDSGKAQLVISKLLFKGAGTLSDYVNFGISEENEDGQTVSLNMKQAHNRDTDRITLEVPAKKHAKLSLFLGSQKVQIPPN